MRNSNSVMAFLLGVSLTVALLSVAGQLHLSSDAKAEVPTNIGLKKYTPTFEEWVSVWLKAQLTSDATGQGVVTGREWTDRGCRWTIHALHRRSDKAALNLWNMKKKVLQHQVNEWKKKGYDISMSDFIIKEPL